MPRHTLRLAVVPGALLLALTCSLAATAAPAPAATPAPAASPLVISGDLRARYEWDWDSHTAAGALRADRDRARIRARIGFTYKLAPAWTLGGRLRTGDRTSQQSPHLTVHANNGGTDDLAVQADRYFIQYKEGALTAWGGRNTTPFWQQNELWWDEDVTPTGAALSYDQKVPTGTITGTGAILALPDGMLHLNGTMFGAQVKYVTPAQPGQFTFAGGLYRFDGHNGARYLRNRNGARDYLLGVASAQWAGPVVGGRPLTLGLDVIRNFEDYSAADVAPYSTRMQYEKGGYVFSVLWGQTKAPRDFQLGYFYAHIEALAVNGSYSQDDWARFGSGAQAEVTDFKGHEIRATYQLAKNLNLMARLFLVEAITSVQDGKRLRVDLNWKF